MLFEPETYVADVVESAYGKDGEKANSAPKKEPDETTPLLPPTSADVVVDNCPLKRFKHARYAATKTSGQAATNVALITSNASQLKTVLDKGPSEDYYYMFLFSLITSIVLQVFVGFLLVWLGSREAKLHDFVDKSSRKTKKIGTIVLTTVFMISILNVIMNAFTAKLLPDNHRLPCVQP